MDLILFDDEIARGWDPFTLTRPAGELLFGTMTLRERIERVLGLACSGHLTAQHLRGFEEENARGVIELDAGRDRRRLYLLSRFLPERATEADWESAKTGPVLTPEGEVVGWFADVGDPAPERQTLLDPASLGGEPAAILQGRSLTNVWELITENPGMLAHDLETFPPQVTPAELPAGAHHIGSHPLYIDPSATIEPGVVLVTTDGPIHIDRGATVRAFTRLAGPAWVGPGSMVLGGLVEAVTIGPVSRIRGEFAESVALGYVNKQHDGHIGHAYLGRWVNLGAETTNSDLKNNYGSIRIRTSRGEFDTGAIKLGSLIGDHVKTGIGLLLNTGTVIGAGSNLYGSEMPPTYVEPFSWGSGSELTEYRLDRFLQVAERAMERRGVSLSEGMREMLSAAWSQSRAGDR